MPRFLRICLMIFGPAPLALFTLWFQALAVELFNVVFHRPEDAPSVVSGFFRFLENDSLVYVIFGIIVACFVAAIPSLLYAIAIELAISEGLDPKSWKLVVVSALLGALCGLCIGILQYHFALPMIFLGAWVGFVIGMIIKLMPERFRVSKRSRSKGKRRRQREITHD